MYQAFLIKYGEIGVKGKNRHIFEDTLVSQTANALKSIDGDFTVRKENGRIYAQAHAEFDFDEAVGTLSRVFGIVGICPVVLAEDEGFERLAQTVIAYVDQALPDKDGSQRRIRRAPAGSLSAAEGGCTQPAGGFACGNPQSDQSVFPDHSGPGRYAGRDSGTGHAAVIGRH